MARKLKYHAPNTDLRALERELSGGSEDVGDDERPDDEEFAAYADRYDSADDDEVREEDWLPPEKQLAAPATGTVRHPQSESNTTHHRPRPPSGDRAADARSH